MLSTDTPLEVLGSPTDQVPRLHLGLALERDDSPLLADEGVVEQVLRGTLDLDPAGGSVRLHATRRVHGVAPEVVEESLATDHPGDDGARVDPDAQLEPEVTDLLRRLHRS